MGFVCAYKIHAEEECLFSKVWCYECDSRTDPNCADPYDSSLDIDYGDQLNSSMDFVTTSFVNITITNANRQAPDNHNNTVTIYNTTRPQQQQQQQTPTGPMTDDKNDNYLQTNNQKGNISLLQMIEERNKDSTNNSSSQSSVAIPNFRDKQQRGDNSMIEIPSNYNDQQQQQQQKQQQAKATNSNRPKPQKCHGCCVKITSRSIQGVKFIKRTCTSNLQINFFMVDHVCMKESGGRGTMCFCETDYCNGQRDIHYQSPYYLNGLITFLSALSSICFTMIQYT